jgi:zinc and cadmium transporter
MEKNLKYLISFSAGVFLIIFINLTNETYEHTGDFLLTGIYLLAGFLFITIVSVFIPEYHHHHTKEIDLEHTHSIKSAQRMILGDAIHNIGDGIVLAIAFMANPFVGLVATLGIVIHETIQEISEFFVLRDAGFSVREALIRNFVASSTILVGAIVGFTIANTEAITALILGISAGAFLFISINDLLPRIIHHSRRDKAYSRYVQFAVLGMLTIFALTSLIGHGPEQEAELDHYDSIGMLE